MRSVWNRITGKTNDDRNGTEPDEAPWQETQPEEEEVSIRNFVNKHEFFIIGYLIIGFFFILSLGDPGGRFIWFLLFLYMNYTLATRVYDHFIGLETAYGRYPIKMAFLYNHRKPFLAGFILLTLGLIQIFGAISHDNEHEGFLNDLFVSMDLIFVILAIILFVKGMYLRNILLLQKRRNPNLIPESSNDGSTLPLGGTGTIPKKALIVQNDNLGPGNDVQDAGPGKSGYDRDPGNDVQDAGPGKSGYDRDPAKSGHDMDPGKGIHEMDPDMDGEVHWSASENLDDPSKDTNHGEKEGVDIWEVQETDFITNSIDKSGVTFDGKLETMVNIAGYRFERHMALFTLSGILFFGSLFAVTNGADGFCLLMLISLMLFIASQWDRKMNGVALFPYYVHMIENNMVYDPMLRDVTNAGTWYERNLMKDGEKVISRDTQMLNSWKQHSYILTNKGIILEERKNLITRNRFVYIPLLTLKKLDSPKENLDKQSIASFITSILWSVIFPLLLIFSVRHVVRAYTRRGRRIYSRALNLNFVLCREVKRDAIIPERRQELEHAFQEHLKDPEAASEVKSYRPLEDLPSAPGLKELKRSVIGACTGLILPVFFLSMWRLMEIMEVGGDIFFLLIVLAFMVFALLNIISTTKKVWHYQLYLERPANSSVQMGPIVLSYPEILILSGYIILAIGLVIGVINDLLSMAFIPAAIGGALILAGRYTYNSTFRGIDYHHRSEYQSTDGMAPLRKLMVEKKRFIPALIAYMIFVCLMVASNPYFGINKAEVPDEFLGDESGNNWDHLEYDDEDIVGLLGLFGAHIRIYEDDAQDGNGYPGVYSVVTLKFPVMPGEDFMLDTMKEVLVENSNDEGVTLEEPPEEGKKKTVQGYEYMYFIYNGTASDRTTTFTRGQEVKIICTAAEIEDKKAIVITVGIAQVSAGTVVLPFLPDTYDYTTWDEIINDLSPNVRIK